MFMYNFYTSKTVIISAIICSFKVKNIHIDGQICTYYKYLNFQQKNFIFYMLKKLNNVTSELLFIVLW